MRLRWRSMHSDEETYRGTLQIRDVDDQPHTVIVMRRGLGRNARVWLTVNGAWKTTLHMTDAEATRFSELLTEAQLRR
jgi:carbon monoxide dehydrogenase subunit G